jgi:transposase
MLGVAYGQALLDADTDKVGAPDALGLDEVLFCRQGRWRTQRWSTQIVDVQAANCSTSSRAAT